ncbi:MAG: hypothetical protein ACLSDO_00730 [Anaerotruncus colihominis]
MKKTYTMVVKDRAGVLSRITAYIRRNGWNVEQVHVTPYRSLRAEQHEPDNRFYKK